MKRALLLLALSGCMTQQAFQHPGQRMPTYAYAIDTTIAGAGLATAVIGDNSRSPAMLVTGLAAFFLTMVPPAFAPRFLP